MELMNILNTFPNKKILIIGDVILDKYTEGIVERVSPEAPVPVLRVNKEGYIPGGAGNAAANAKSLSAEVHLFGFIGHDSNGEELKKILESRGINCYFEKNSLTIMKERIIGKSSGQQQQMVRIDREEISDKFFSSSINKLLELAEKSDRIIISDYAKGSITPELMNHLANYKSKIILDPKPANKNFKSIYKNVFLMTPNRKEAFEMSGYDNVREAGEHLRKEFNSNILITLGKDGMVLFPIEEQPIHIKTTPQESFEETGAGDTAIASLTLSLYDNSTQSIVSAAKLANYAAGITIKHLGNYCPTIEELRQEILKNENTKSRTTQDNSR